MDKRSENNFAICRVMVKNNLEITQYLCEFN